MDIQYPENMKKVLMSMICTAGGFVLIVLLVIFGILYIAVGVVQELADYLFRKIRRS